MTDATIEEMNSKISEYDSRICRLRAAIAADQAVREEYADAWADPARRTGNGIEQLCAEQQELIDKRDLAIYRSQQAEAVGA